MAKKKCTHEDATPIAFFIADFRGDDVEEMYLVFSCSDCSETFQVMGTDLR